MQLIGKIETKFKVKIKEVDVAKITSYDKALSIINKKMNNFLNKNFKKTGFKILPFKDQSICKDIKKCINKYFYKSTKYYQNLSLNEFRKLVLKCQNSIINMNIHQRFANSEKKKLKKF